MTCASLPNSQPNTILPLPPPLPYLVPYPRQAVFCRRQLLPKVRQVLVDQAMAILHGQNTGLGGR